MCRWSASNTGRRVMSRRVKARRRIEEGHGEDHDVARDPVEQIRPRHEEEQRDEAKEQPEEEAPRIAHEDLRRRKVVPQERENRAADDERDRGDERQAEEIPRDGERAPQR